MIVWIWDIITIWWIFKKLISYIKNRFFGETNWQNESLQQDILEYFKEFYKEVKKMEKNPKNKEIKEVMRELDDKIENLSNENYCLDNFDEKYIRKILDKYKKKWEYGKIFYNFEIKFKSYWSSIVECIENYWDTDWKKMLKERKILNSFLNKNINKLKRWYIDFLMFFLFNDMLDTDVKEKIINQNISLIDFEKYIPVTNKFFDKVESRILVK